MSRRVVITGMGCVSGLGAGIAESWRRLRAGDGAIRPLERPAPPDKPSRAMDGPAAWIEPDGIADALAGRDLRRLGQLDPLSAYALLAAVEAVDQAGLAEDDVLRERTVVVLGCGSHGNATIEVGYERLYGRDLARLHPQTIPASMISAPASHIAMLLGIHGPAFVLASACASSAHALGEAMHMIRAGRADVAIAGGSEACLTLGSWAGWQSLGVIAPDTCRPFSRERKGLVLGEGAAILVLEGEEHARARGAPVLGELAGYGATSDAAHMTAPDQAGVEAAIRAAHRDAGVALAQPALISSHGTGTRLNDSVEAAAMRAVYGDALRDHTVIATKSAHGHLIGATGALEFLLGMRALSEGLAPPVLNHLGLDPDCALPLALEAGEIGNEVLVSNSFAFGGLNAVLIGRKAA
jgi:nodulation protein E